MEHDASEHLFSYGTLQEEAVQFATFKRKLDGQPDTLVGYRIGLIPIRDPNVVKASAATHYRNAEFTGLDSDLVDGTVFTVTRNELELADDYEADAAYKRVRVELQSGTVAWVYVFSQQ